MNLEALRNVGSQIETQDFKEKQEILFEKIEKISLVYADQKFQEIKKDNKNYKFSEAVKTFSPIKNIILRPVFCLEKFDLKEYQEKIDLFLQDFYNEIDSVYEVSDFDLDKILGLVSLKRDSIKKHLGVESLKTSERSKKEGDTKVLNFNNITNIEMDAEKKYKDLEMFGFSKSDHFVEIHMEDFYGTGEKNLSSDLIKNDLSVVAEYIIDKEPEAVAVIGESWLLNTPLADIVGFKKIEDETTKQNDFSTWLQFIDKDGQINQKRFNNFLKTEKLPYKSTKAYIPTEEFLRKYLPESRKGKIVLKEINEVRKDFWDKIKAGISLVKTDWEYLLKNNGDLEDFIKNNKTLNESFDFVAPDNKAEYFHFLKIMYDKKIPWGKFYDHKSESIKQIDEKMNKAMQSDMFKDKEVFIE